MLYPDQIGQVRIYKVAPLPCYTRKHFALICMLCEWEWDAHYSQPLPAPCPQCGQPLGVPGEVAVWEVVSV